MVNTPYVRCPKLIMMNVLYEIYKSFKLLLPALIPSWNFFDLIAPSPRIQFSLFNDENKSTKNWQEFRPRPKHLSFSQMILRMLWNPRWNESLYLVSCAERIIENYTKHSEIEILTRIKNNLNTKNNRRSYDVEIKCSMLCCAKANPISISVNLTAVSKFTMAHPLTISVYAK